MTCPLMCVYHAPDFGVSSNQPTCKLANMDASSGPISMVNPGLPFIVSTHLCKAAHSSTRLESSPSRVRGCYLADVKSPLQKIQTVC
jgi:hypothetical protein